MLCILPALLSLLMILKPTEVVAIITHVLHKRKLWLMMVSSPAQNSTISKWQSQDSSSSLSGFKAQTLHGYDLQSRQCLSAELFTSVSESYEWGKPAALSKASQGVFTSLPESLLLLF